jgi:molecular chaperone Hsp33
MDRIIRAVSDDGFVKMSVVTAKDIVQYAGLVHACSPTATAALGRALCAGAMLGDMMKEEDASLTIRINGGGPIGRIVAVSDSSGCVRGYVSNPGADLPVRPDGKLDVGGLVGRDGMFTVSRDIGLKEPYIGSTELVSGEIAEDLTAYLLESEQVPSACGLGVLIDTDLSVKAAGGFIVQLMPGAPDELSARLEDNVFYMDQLTAILCEDGAETVFTQVLKGLAYHSVCEKEISYRCYCSRERVAEAILSVGAEEVGAMISEGKDIDVSCQFCDKVYHFTPAELRDLIGEKKS